MTDLGEIKDILRSLAISCPRVMTVEDLRRDYRATENQECPYYALGYRNFTAFLQSIPDVITVLPNGVVRAVTTKETQHVQKLVNFQKKPKARSRGFSRSSSYSRSGPRKYAPAPRFSSAPPSKPVSQRPLNHPNPSSHRPALNQPMEQFFARVREVKEAARRDSIDSVTCQNVVNPSVEAGWSGVDFVHQWQEEHCGEDDSSCKRRVLVPDYESSEDSYDSFYERFKDHNEDPVDNIQGRLPTEVSTKDSGLDAYFQNESDAVSDKLKLNLRNLMKMHPSGFWACLLPEKYKEEYGVSLSWNELGFDSVVQMAHELPNIFLCKRVHGGDWMLFDASQPLPGEYTENVRKTSMKTDLSPDPVVPEYVKGKIYHIVRKFKGGIRAEQLTQLYCEHYGRTLHSDAPGFSDDESLYISIQNTVIYLRYIRNECYVYPEVNPESEQLDLPTLDVDTETKKRLGLYPEEVMGPGDKMKSPQLPANIEVGVYVELKVAEVYSPHKFWIILRESYGLLESLMDELQDFYRDHGSKYIMSDSTIVEGIYCTALYSGEWHRACVKSVHKNVEVFYVDYGTVHEVPRSELRFLHKDFCSLPCQAIRASLSLIQPSNGRQRFTREANQVFLNLVVEKFLIGVVQRVDSQEPFLELFLVDTNGENDVHLNDVLVNLEHASFKPGLLETTDNVVSSQDSQKVRETQETLAGGQSYAEPQADKQSRELKTVVLDPSNCQTGTNLPSYPDNVVFSTPLVHGKVSNDIPSAPPPGFSNAIPPASSMNANSQGMLGYFMNPVLAAAYSPMYLQQMNAAALVQQQLQQQQQALLLAYYSNLYQQQSAALIAAQHVSPLQVQQKQQPPSFQITAQMQSTALSPSSEEVRQVTHNESLTSKLLSRETTGSIQKTASQHSFSNVSDSSSSDGCGKYATRRKKTSRRRTQENRPQTSLSSKIRTTRLFETDSDEASNIESSCNVGLPRNLVCPDVEKLNLNNEDFARAPVFSGTDDDLEIDHLNRLPKTGSQPGTLGEMSHAQDHHPSPHVISDDDDLEINHLSDLQAHTISSCLSSSTSSSRAAPPDLVQSVANLKVSSRVSTITNFWKVEEISGKTVHVFNINGKGYISTGELARKFTPFSTRDILVRVLNNKEIFACYKKLTRQEELPLFSALDGCDKEVVESFDLILQESGSVKGVFHLTSLINIPSMLISLNIDPFTAREFQRLRDKFDPNDCFWIT